MQKDGHSGHCRKCEFSQPDPQRGGYYQCDSHPGGGDGGILDNHEDVMTVNFRKKGDMIFLIGRSDNDISSSEYLSFVHLINESAAPKFDLEYEMKLQEVVGI